MARSALNTFNSSCVLIDMQPDNIDKPVLALIGPTAIGKTSLSLTIARKFQCEIISVDSMQVYRYMDIGTAKATKHERLQVPHHLIDIVDPNEPYNAARFVHDCLNAISVIHQKGAIPLLTGGTGLYLQALKNGLFDAPPSDKQTRAYLQDRVAEEGSQQLHKELKKHDPVMAEKLHPNDSSRIIRALEVFLTTGVSMTQHLKTQAQNQKRLMFSNFHSIGLSCERKLLYQRINKRTDQLIKSGLEEEVNGLLERGYGPELTSMQSIGYKHMVQYIIGDWTLEQTREFLARDTRRYAKRQYTWFNRDQSIRWFDRNEEENIISWVDRNLEI